MTMKKRGFAAMTYERRTAIAAQGGRAAHAKGTAHEFTQETARIAGQKGARVRAMKGRVGGGTLPPGSTTSTLGEAD